ncbi:MAG: purine-binding chemotaxis protein CheW [Deltaproteobacteria bacterium]|nr:MAG: purine-binding chemotaxis protein CheW [Deltaproteobacteria bacterium]
MLCVSSWTKLSEGYGETMDLVEIRKKAKKKKRPGKKTRADRAVEKPGAVETPEVSSDDAAAVAAVPGAEATGPAPEITAPDSFPAEPEHPVSAPEPVVASPDGLSGDDRLDKLFSGEGDFALATEEAYLKALQAAPEEEAGERRRWLSFALGHEQYAVDIEQVREIIKPREVTEIPRTPDFLLGVISLRGVVVPIYDLCRRLRLGETGLSERTRIIVCELDDRIAGLLVDNISQVVDVAEQQIEPPPAILTGLDRDMVEGVGRVQGRMIVLLNVEQVLAVDNVTA